MEDSPIITKFWINHQPSPAPKQKFQRKRIQGEKKIQNMEDSGPKLVFLIMFFAPISAQGGLGILERKGQSFLELLSCE